MGQNPGLAREGFDLDLKHGEARQSAFGQMMLESNCTRVTVEHKSDGKARDTGNVFIEYRQRGRKSGIATTVSDFYAIEIYPKRWIVITTEDLKAICRRVMKEDPGRACVRGGDFKRYEGVLVRVTELL